jgi:transcription elongation GreA/GreB family factor
MDRLRQFGVHVLASLAFPSLVIEPMSRAFVKEQDDIPGDLPERPVSSNPNLVTARGLRLIDASIEALRQELARAQHDADRAAVARTSRDLRYWTRRRATAQPVSPPATLATVAFATAVVIERADGRHQRFAIVGEDEADPARGFIAYCSPLARAILGKRPGEAAETPGGEVEIVAVEAMGEEDQT